MQITSSSVADGVAIPLKYAEPGVHGDNVQPALAWSDAPEGTQSFMVTCFDPDAPTGSGWWHWVVTDIPADVHELPEGGPLPEAARTWPTDYGYAGWGGPWPPPGPAHHYEFKVTALDVERLDIPDNTTSANARLMASFAVLDSAKLVATFANPES